MYEKRKIIFRKVIWTILLLIGIIAPIIIANLPSEDVELIYDSGSIESYYESINSSTCNIEVTFNTEVESGYITVSFYNADNQLLSTEESYLWGYGTTLSGDFYSIPGKVDSYEIVNYTVTVANSEREAALTAFIFIDVFIFVFFIAAMTLSLKICIYNGYTILIYAGWYHHYIKVNEIILDEHNTLFQFSAIELSCVLSDGTDLKARITTANRISLKINNQLYAREQ